MTNATKIAIRFREIIFDGKWVAYTNLNEQLADLSWKQASQSIAPLNNIAAITAHLTYYISGVADYLEGQELTISDKNSWSAPPISSAKDWDDVKNALFTHSDRFAKATEKLTDEELNLHFVKETYGTYNRNLQGMIEHCYYHFGQIVIIKKLVLAQIH